MCTGAELQAQLFFRGQSGPTLSRLTHEIFYVPGLAGWPRWFLAAGKQRGSVPAGRLFVMVQSARSAPWKTAMALYDSYSAEHMLRNLAAAVRDADEYVGAVPPGDSALVVSPSAMPARYARYLDGRASRAGRRLFAPGFNTTYYLSTNRKVSRGAGRYGWRDTDHQAPSRLPIYALRTADGGALVLFTTTDTEGWQALSESAALPARPSRREADYVPPAFVLRRLRVHSVRTGMRLSATAVDRVLAYVPPIGSRSDRIYVLINNGAATEVHGSGLAAWTEAARQRHQHRGSAVRAVVLADQPRILEGNAHHMLLATSRAVASARWRA
ncbi:MAG: hypothetical protein LBI49_16335 [Nocardiopsaceae bacterium]|nr:hypothetical protein [Nocardiopsaceae bacterium]